MKMKFFILAAAMLSTNVFANESVISNYQVPFYNVDIQPNNKIQASYNFDPNHQILVCTTSSLDFLSIGWQYKGKQNETILPVGGHLSLKGNTYPEGYFADSKGLVTIANEKPVSLKATVSCEYHTWA